jgi:hypothetical protein
MAISPTKPSLQMNIAFERLPVEVLVHNVIHSFETVAKRNAHLLKAAVDAGIIRPQIDYLLDRIPPTPPMVKLSTRMVTLQESYLAFLWAYIYSNFVIFEKGVQEKQIAGTFSGSIYFDTPLLDRAKRLENWRDNFTARYGPWDESLPNPRLPLTGDENSFVAVVAKKP